MIRTLGLRTCLLLLVLPVLVGLAACAYALTARHERRILEGEAEKRALAIARVLAVSAADALAGRRSSSYELQWIVEQARSLGDVRALEIVDSGGVIVAGWDRIGGDAPRDRTRQRSLEPLVASALRENEEQWRLHADAPGGVEAVKPVVATDAVVGAVRVDLALGAPGPLVARSRAGLHALLAAIVIGTGGLLVVVWQLLTAPLRRLAHVAQAVSAGDLERRAEIHPSEEVAGLARAINAMSARLRSAVEGERRAREHLQGRVHQLLTSAERVSTGDLDLPPAPEGDDDMGRLAAGFNDMVRNLRLNMEIQRASLFELEESARALSDANAQLKELDRLKSEFLNTVSHELRTPLTSIKAFSELLLDAPEDDTETLHEFLTIIHVESDRLTRLINNLLDLSRIEAGRMQWELGSVEAREVIDACTASLRALFDQKGLVLEVSTPDDLVFVADRDKIIQVVTNLLSNAVKFTPRGGLVRVEAARRHEGVEIEVSDTGTGIPPEFHESVFEKFQQVDASCTREAKGSGLGLPIVRTIVEAHGGTVRVESEVGRGSRFVVRLPVDRLGILEGRSGGGSGPVDAGRSPEAVAGDPGGGAGRSPEAVGGDPGGGAGRSPEAVGGDPGGGAGRSPEAVGGDPGGGAGATPSPERIPGRPPRRILVVDDESNIIRVMRHILESEGFTVAEAGSGEEALLRVREERPDLVLLDVLLPDVDGFEVLARWRGQPDTADLPVVVLSILEAREESLRRGAQDYFNKPIDRARLLESVQALLGNAPQDLDGPAAPEGAGARQPPSRKVEAHPERADA